MVADIDPLLQPQDAEILASVKGHAERLLNHTPRFRFFTLHGSEHLDGLFRILALLLKGGVENGARRIVPSGSLHMHP